MCTKMYNELLREFRKIENYKEFEKQLKDHIKWLLFDNFIWKS